MDEISILLFTAVTIGFLHTILGPDHYIPFIAMARSGNWSIIKTMIVTSFCGLAHVLSSVLLGFIGIALGIVVTELEFIESSRGEIAGWLLISFGLLYMIWGIRKVIRKEKHSHSHSHYDGESHSHNHSHDTEHSHVHKNKINKITPWILFTIFIFGPCEALIPILMYPAATQSLTAMYLVVIAFAITTIATMLLIVLGTVYGFSKISLGRFEKYSHALAGGLVLLCGISVKFLGL